MFPKNDGPSEIFSLNSKGEVFIYKILARKSFVRGSLG